LSQKNESRCSFHPDFLSLSLSFSLPPQAVSAVTAEDGVRFMQEMMELSSQQQKEQLPPRAIQIVSHPFLGRVVLTAGPAQFGIDLSKSSTGVSGFCGFAKALDSPSALVLSSQSLSLFKRALIFSENIFSEFER